MADGSGAAGARDRRWFLRALAAGGLAGLAGCGMGADGRDGTSTSPSTTQPPTSPPPTSTSTTTSTTPQTSTEEPTTTTGGLVEDATCRMVIPPPYPDEVAYNPIIGDYDRGGAGVWFDGYDNLTMRLYRRSLVDGSLVPEAAETLNYRTGTLDVKLREDCSWASDSDEERSPKPIVAADWIEAAWVIDKSYANDVPFAELEETGERSFRIFYDEPYHEDYALSDQLTEFLVRGHNAAFWRPQLDRFADASTDDERDDVWDAIARRELSTAHPMTNTPFRVTGTEDDRWIMTLRDDEEQTPHWVDDATFDRAEIVGGDVSRQTQAFTDGQLPFAGSRPTDEVRGGGFPQLDVDVIDADVPFETETITLPQEWAPAGYGMHLGRPPTDNVHFRRALAYLLDRNAHRTRFMEGDQVITGFSTAPLEERYLSADLHSILRDGPHDNYGYAAVMRDAATAELRAGGFEQDSEGRWLYQSGDQAGEPIAVTLNVRETQERIATKAEAFAVVLSEEGIDTTVARLDSSGYVEGINNRTHLISVTDWGGYFPYDVYSRGFSAEPFADRDGPIFVPETLEGPPVGEFATPTSVATDQSETYGVAGMVDALTTTGWDAGQQLIDRLAWIYNQSVAFLPIGIRPYVWTIDRQYWTWPTPVEEHPEQWVSYPRSTLWWKGHVQARRGE